MSEGEVRERLQGHGACSQNRRMASRRSLAGLLVLMVGVATAIACGDTEPPDVPTYGPPNGIAGKSPQCPAGVTCPTGSSGGGSSGSGSSGGGSSGSSSGGGSSGSSSGGTSSSGPSYACTISGGSIVDAGPCSVSWLTTIWPAMQGAWGCASATCHGGGTDPPMDGTASQAYATLADYTAVNSEPYFNPCSTSASASAFVCNTALTGTCGIQMPLASGGTISDAGLTEIATWVACGAPEN